MLEVDEILSQLGKPGRYHVGITFLILLNMWPVGFNHSIMAFFGAHTIHECRLPHEDNNVTQWNRELFVYVFFNQTLRVDVGSPVQNHQANVSRVDSCHVIENSSDDSAKISCPFGWKYDVEPGENTIVTEWDLVCDRAYLNSLSTTIYFLGVLIGGLTCGHLADKYGRRSIILATLVISTVLGTGLAFVDNYVLFVMIRFVIGFCMQGLQSSSFILMTELFTPRGRSFAGVLSRFAVDAFYMLLALITYLVKDWRHVQLVCTAPFFLLVCEIWILPESPRWLASHGRQKDANKIFRKAAKFNNIRLSENIFGEDTEMFKQQNSEGKEDSRFKKQHNCLDLLRTPNLRKRSIILFYLSFATLVVDVGNMYAVSTLPGNKYLLFFLASLASALVSLTLIPLQKRFERRTLLCVFLAVTMISALTAGFVPQKTASGADISLMFSFFALAARATSGCSVSLTMVVIAETLPTCIRSSGVGCCMVWMRVGSMIAPQFLFLSELTFAQLPFLLFGGLTCIASALVLILPDLSQRHLPDTIEDVENETDPGFCHKMKQKRLKNVIGETVINEETSSFQ